MSTHGAGGYDMYVVRTNSTGDSLWSRTIGGFGDDRAFSVATTQDGSHLVTGWTWSYGQGLGDVYLVKLQDSVVPVELTNFSANVNGDDVILNWSTASEINNQGFEIHRKISDKGNQQSEWNMIGFVNGSGTTSETRNYNFTDYNLISGSYSYRLKQIDFDGTYEYSDIVEVEVNSIPTRFSLEQNYPNPFNPTTNFEFQIANSGFVNLKIFDVLGNKVETLVNEEKEPGLYKIKYDASRLSSGVYYYTLTANGFTDTQKFILLK